MPSKSRRSGEADGEYEWDEPAQHSSGKKSRSKVPSEEKLNKRRDQNRVSQRAFRQRKEKHTRELELKVEELENLLENASQENSLVTSQMQKMEEELCYYRRLLFTGNNGNQGGVYTPPSSETPTVYTSSTSSWAQSHPYSTAPSNGSSSAHSSPTLSNIPGDFAPVGNADGYWGGYDVPEIPQTQQYQDYKYADTSAYISQSQW